MDERSEDATDGGGEGRWRPPGDVWFVLHGYRQLARRFLRRFRPLDDGSCTVVAPEALSRFYVGGGAGRHGPGSTVGASWMTREDREHEISDYIAYLDRLGDRVLGADPTQDGASGTTLLGFSQGAHTAVRWAVRGRHRPDRLVLWGGYLPSDLDLNRARERLREVAVVLVRGERDPTRDVTLAREEAALLDAIGVRPRVVEWSGGHAIDAGVLMEIASG